MNGSAHAVVIVGAGPAGSAAALRIAARRPDLAARTLVLDRRKFPRDKLCAGGLSPLSETYLARIDAAPAVATCPVPAMEGPRRPRVADCFAPPSGLAFRTVRRIEFDAALVELARSRGVSVVEGERVRALEVGTNGRHSRDRSTGAPRAHRQDRRGRGEQRRAQGDRRRRRRAWVSRSRRSYLAIRSTTPHSPRGSPPSTSRRSRPGSVATAGSSPLGMQTRGPGAQLRHRSVCSPDSVRFGQQARSFLVEWLASRGLWCDPSSIRGHSGITYDPDQRLGGQRVCLAGDAAGVDPFWGEGIPCALATGNRGRRRGHHGDRSGRVRPDQTQRAGT